MTGRSSRRRRLAASAAVLLYAVGTVMSCARREKIQHGVKLIDKDRQLVVASLGSCGCMTFRNMLKDPVAIVSKFKGADIGVQVLAHGDSVRVRFDWAGPDAADVYDIVAYDYLTRQAKGEAARLEFSDDRVVFRNDSLAVGGVTDARCNDDEVCEFGSMNMNRAAGAAMGRDEVAVVRRGVRQTKADEVLEVSAARDQCGCLLVRNEAMETVFVTSTLRGRAVGGMSIDAGVERYVGFDWAGDSSTDVYRVTALIPGSSGRAGEASGSTSAKPSTDLPAPGTTSPDAEALAATPDETAGTATPRTFERLVKFAPDGLRIVGRMDAMPCTKQVTDADRERFKKEAFNLVKKEYPHVTPAVEEQLIRYAAGIEDVEFPELDPNLDPAIAERIRRGITAQRAVHADGAEFTPPTGHKVSCPFDDLNMNQIWLRSVPASPGLSAKPAQAGGQKD